MKFTPKPNLYHLKPRNIEAYNKALKWLEENDPLDTVDAINNEMGEDIEAIYREFSTVYSNNTNINDYPGTYNPFGWGERATFVFGYLMGKAAAMNKAARKIDL